jgi:hypothetical protein
VEDDCGDDAQTDMEEIPPLDFTKLIIAELSDNKELIKLGADNSSSGSDSAPSEDNLSPAELKKNLPVVDKFL